MTKFSNEAPRNILIIGSGGREHALGWKLRQSKLVYNIYYAPGNGGTSKNVGIEANQISDLIAFAKKYNCLTIVGPEAPLANGIVDSFHVANLPILGPFKEGAMLESSKVFSKQFMKQNNIPTADFRVFSNSEDATDYVKNRDSEVVIKLDGLAAGKGVFIPSHRDGALETIQNIMDKKEFGEAGSKILVERKLTGRELSLIILTDGSSFKLLASAKDYKRILENDMGPNTGGMGSFSPVPFFSEEIYNMTLKKIVEPTMRGIRIFSEPFKGFLYFGLMLDEFTNDPYLLEFNVRMGDPECQPIMLRMKSDLYQYIQGTLDGSLETMEPFEWTLEHAVCVVMASQGYPGAFKSGLIIRGVDADLGENVTLFHSGTTRDLGNQLLTRGGRVLGITACGLNLETAAAHAYKAVEKVSWGNNEQYYRKDIAKVMD
jgi:phosphoribosylamine---glycine ligase